MMHFLFINDGKLIISLFPLKKGGSCARGDVAVADFTEETFGWLLILDSCGLCPGFEGPLGRSG